MQDKSKPIDEGCVLLVDDEEPIRESLGELLRECGFTVLLAESYDVAVAVLQANQEIEAILADWKMPGKSGLEILRYINRKNRKIPLLFLTGYGSLTSCQEALREGAFDYILKPVDNKDGVVFPLRHAVEKCRLEKKNQEMREDINILIEGIEESFDHLFRDAKVKKDLEGVISEILGRLNADEG